MAWTTAGSRSGMGGYELHDQLSEQFFRPAGGYFANFSSSVGSTSEEIYSQQAVYFSYTYYDVEIVSLTDSVYGDLNGQGSCEVPATVQAGDFMRCEFSEAPEPNVRERVHNNVVTVSARPAGSAATRANTVSATDQAWVLFREAIARIPEAIPAIPNGVFWVFGVLGLLWLRKKYQ